MDINDKTDFITYCVLSGLWLFFALLSYIFGPVYIGIVFTVSALITGAVALVYYLKNHKTETTDEIVEEVIENNSNE